jgi:hypothetical protein
MSLWLVRTSLVVRGLVRVSWAGSADTAFNHAILALASAVSGAIIWKGVSCSFARSKEWGSAGRSQVAAKGVDAGVFAVVVL